MSEKRSIPRRSVPSLSPEERLRKRNIQISLGITVLAACITLAFFLQTQSPNGAYIWFIGLGLGYTLQRSRFCFTAAVRDPKLTGSTELTKAVILSLALSSVILAALQIKATGWDVSALDPAKVKLPGFVADAGVHTLVGGFLFGVGAVLAGGCASGTLMRLGEGFLQQWITLFFFIAGAILGGWVLIAFKSTGFLYTPVTVHLPQAFGGWAPALVVQFGSLFGLYVLADWYGKKKAGSL